MSALNLVILVGAALPVIAIAYGLIENARVKRRRRLRGGPMMLDLSHPSILADIRRRTTGVQR